MLRGRNLGEFEHRIPTSCRVGKGPTFNVELREYFIRCFPTLERSGLDVQAYCDSAVGNHNILYSNMKLLVIESFSPFGLGYFGCFVIEWHVS